MRSEMLLTLVWLFLIVVGSYTADRLNAAWVRYRRKRWPRKLEAVEGEPIEAIDRKARADEVVLQRSVQELGGRVRNVESRQGTLEKRVEHVEHDVHELVAHAEKHN